MHDDIKTAPVESVRARFDLAPEWARGRCPECGDLLVSNCYYTAARGYIIVRECYSSLSNHPTCDYRRVV